MTSHADLKTMTSILAFCVESPSRQRTLDSIVRRYDDVSDPELASETDVTLVKERDKETQSALSSLERGLQKTSITFKHSEKVARLARVIGGEGITFELDPEAYIQLADRCLGSHDGELKVNA